MIQTEESACNAGDPSSIPGLVRSPVGRAVATHSSILAWKSLAGYSPWDQRVRYHGVMNSSLSPCSYTFSQVLILCERQDRDGVPLPSVGCWVEGPK